MKSYVKMLNAVKFVGSSVLTVGIAIFLYGFLVSDYTLMTGIGVGTVMGAVFIFLIGLFFVATEEMLEKRYKGINVAPIKRKKGAPL
jgi:uncharacterized membrane protein YiaA